jgi:hypothetical protein
MKNIKYLRQYIRQILKEETASERDERRQPFVLDLLGRDFDTAYRETTDEDYATDEEIRTMYQSMAGMGRKLKQAFATHADREYLDSLKYVHWTTFRRRALAMLAPEIIKGVDVNPRDELSTMAYRPGEIPGRSTFGKYGIVVDGYVTLLANDMDALQTGYTHNYKKADPDRVASSGANKGIAVADDESIVLSAEDWNPDDGLGNEALIDNWEITGLIVPDDEYDTFVRFMDKIYEKTGKEYLLYKASQMS